MMERKTVVFLYNRRTMKLKRSKTLESECGAQGLYLAKVDEYNTATENVEKAEQFDKAIAQLTKWKSSLSAAKNAYVAKYQEDIDASINSTKCRKQKKLHIQLNN